MAEFIWLTCNGFRLKPRIILVVTKAGRKEGDLLLGRSLVSLKQRFAFAEENRSETVRFRV